MNDAMDGVIAQARQEIKDARRIFLTSHVRADGDAAGSLLGMGLSLQSAGKKVQLVLEDGLPSSFRFLPGADLVKNHAEDDFDYVITLDCSDLSRVGGALKNLSSSNGASPVIPDLNIDHHITNMNFARLNIVHDSAVATSEILATHLPLLGLPVDSQVAVCLLTGIITDTIGFRTNNLTARTMRIAAELMDKGANLPDLYRQSLGQRSYEAARYWGQGLTHLERDGSIIWASLSLADRSVADYPGRDDADLINVISSIIDAKIALVFVEQNNGSVKVSWRAQPGYDVSQIALRFGGGGHEAASGAELKGSLNEVCQVVLNATRPLVEAS